MGKETRLEKAIRGLKAIENEAYERWVHNQHIKDELIQNIDKYVPDAILLLEYQKPIAPVEREGFYYCGACKYAFSSWRPKFCSYCGKKVEWND